MIEYLLILQMVQIIRIITGQWTKSADGVWRFNDNPFEVEQYILAKTNQEFQSLISLVREEIGIGEKTPMVVSYQLPPNLLLPYGSTSAPTNLLTAEDVELVMSVQEWTKEVQLCVTFGAANVAKYNFLYREPFTIDGITFLSDGITEEEHLAAIIGE